MLALRHKRASIQIGLQLTDIDGILSNIPLIKRVKGSASAAGTISLRHDLGVKPTEVFLTPNSAVTIHVTDDNRKAWSTQVVVVTVSGACVVTGMVMKI